MSETEWRKSTDPIAMLGLLNGKASNELLLRFAVACCRRIWPLMLDMRSRAAVELAEQISQGVEIDTDFQRQCFSSADSVRSLYKYTYARRHSAKVAQEAAFRFAAEAAAWTIADGNALEIASNVSIKVQGARCKSLVVSVD